MKSIKTKNSTQNSIEINDKILSNVDSLKAFLIK